MFVVHIDSKDQLIETIRWIFNRDSRKEANRPDEMLDFCFDDVCEILNIDPAVVESTCPMEEGTDEYHDWIADLNWEDLFEFIQHSGKYDLVANFKAGTLIWDLSNDSDRLGSYAVRTFLFYPDAEVTYEAFLEERKQRDEEYLEDIKFRREMAKAKSMSKGN